MEVSSTSRRQKVSSFFEKLPLKLRQIIYTFAITRSTPIEPHINYYGGDRSNDGSILSHVRVYAVDDFRMLAVNRELRRQMMDALYAETSFDISLRREDGRKGVCMHQIDLRRIRRCRLVLHDMESNECDPHMDMWPGSYPFYWFHHLQALAATFFFKGHQLQAMLVECESQNPEWLAECLKPMGMLRGVGMIHFRFYSVEMFRYFKYLETLIMSNRNACFNDKEFRDYTRAYPPHDPLRDTRGVPVSRWKLVSKGVNGGWGEEREATAKILYKKLGIEGEMKPQEYL